MYVTKDEPEMSKCLQSIAFLFLHQQQRPKMISESTTIVIENSTFPVALTSPLWSSLFVFIQ